jgi:hypothetical protein
MPRTSYPGINFQEADADLSTWSGLTPSAFFQTLVDDSTVAAFYQSAAVAGGIYVPQRVLFRLIGADMNVTTDQSFTKLGTFTSYIVSPGGGAFARVVNASTNLNTVAGGIYDAAAKGGNALVAAAATYATLTGSGLGMNLTATAPGIAVLTATPILSLSTPQGGAATADFYIMGVPIS